MVKYNFEYLLIIIIIFVFGCEKSHDTSPNIVFILTDDLAYADLSSYGSEFITTPNIDTVNLSNAKSYDPNTNIFLKPGVGITKVDLKHVQAKANFGNMLSFTIDILCENIHDYYDFVEPIFCLPGAKFNLDVAW